MMSVNLGIRAFYAYGNHQVLNVKQTHLLLFNEDHVNYTVIRNNTQWLLCVYVCVNAVDLFY